MQTLIAVLALGLPVGLLSYLLLRRSFQTGRVNPGAACKVGPAAPKETKPEVKKKTNLGTNLVFRKWAYFGGGFYGVAALWTLLVTELEALFSLIINWPGIGGVFEGGLGAFLNGVIKNQIENFVTAITWFGYWSDFSGDINIGFLFLLAMGSYSIGRRAARAVPLDNTG